MMLASHASAEVPQTITVQGRLTDSLGNAVIDGDYSITFAIYDAPTGGDPLWTSGTQIVTVASGLFTCQLGLAVQLLPDLYSILTPTKKPRKPLA